MLADHASYRMLRTVAGISVDVSFFWQRKLFAWWTRKPAKETFIESLQDANVFEEWETAAFQLDELNGNDLWRQNPTSKHYDYRLIYSRLQSIIEAREDDDILGLVNLLRSGLVRNLGNITGPRLFNRAYAGTKLLIEDYITQVALAIDHVATYPTSPNLGNESGGLTSQAKLDLLHDTRQAFGRSALVLQGGAIFGLCHIGVVKALHLRGVLPRIIVGTETGALIAALVAVHGEGELLNFLTGDRIDLSAFAARRTKKAPGDSVAQLESTSWSATLIRRMKRFIREGYFLDVSMLEECVRANVGDLTFEEAYAKTKRVLNITVPTDMGGGVPGLLNYLTAPNVLIWSAAVASNATSTPLYAPITLLCKSPTGEITPWSTTNSPSCPPTRAWTITSTTNPPPGDPRTSPLSRTAELFNVNHFLVSQARPYIAPFLQTGDMLSHAVPRASVTHPRSSSSANSLCTSVISVPLLRVLVLEIQHRLRQLDALGLLHSNIRRFLVDEVVPGPSLTLVPELSARDFWGLVTLERPTRKGIEEWILRGEKSVWPAVGALKVRCAVEVELDRAYQIVRRRKPMDALNGSGGGALGAKLGCDGPGRDGGRSDAHGMLRGGGEKRLRLRANSGGDVPREKAQ